MRWAWPFVATLFILLRNTYYVHVLLWNANLRKSGVLNMSPVELVTCGSVVYAEYLCSQLSIASCPQGVTESDHSSAPAGRSLWKVQRSCAVGVIPAMTMLKSNCTTQSCQVFLPASVVDVLRQPLTSPLTPVILVTEATEQTSLARQWSLSSSLDEADEDRREGKTINE